MGVSVLSADLFESDAATRIGELGFRRDLRYTEDFNGPGFGEVSVPSAQALGIDFDDVVKVSLDGTVVGAFVIETKDKTHIAADGTRWVRVSGRGLMCWLEDAVVWPQGGIAYNYSPTDRPFNYAGVSSHWYSLVTWAAPLGFKQSATSSGDYRYKSPKGWPDPGAYWIWPTNPAATVAANARAWMRSTFALEAPRKMRFYATADNAFELYLDGALILGTSDVQAEGANYTGFAEKVIQVPAGPHILAAYVTNGASGSPGDRAGFLFTSTLLNPNGTPSTVLRHSDLTNWVVTQDEPLWYAAEILDVVLAEHRGRIIDEGQAGRLQNLTIGWSNTQDSDAVDWTTAKAMAIRCGTNALDVLNLLVDHSIDFWVDPDTVTLNAYEVRGTDRSQAVVLAAAKNLEAFDTSSTATRDTVALVRSAAGWTQATNTTGAAAHGRRETFLEFGNTRSESTAASAGARILKRTAKPTIATPRVEFTISPDARPFLDFAPGDRITNPASTTGQTTARVLALSLIEDNNAGGCHGEALLEGGA